MIRSCPDWSCPFGAVLELRFVYEYSCDELELPFDRGLITSEEKATTARIGVTADIKRRIEGVSEGNAAP
jgi:hypothetical protein